MKRLLFLGMMATAALAQDVDFAPLTNNVVRITTAGSAGAGIVIGADDESVLIVTARHAVPEREVEVRFNAARHKRYQGRAEPVSDEIDFALVVVAMGKDDAVRRSLKPLAYRAEKVPVGTTVSNIDGDWAANRDVNKLQSEQLTAIAFSKTGIASGSSGGPLFDDKGRLIGMVTSFDAKVATAVKMQAMLDVLASWNVQANLLGGDKPSSSAAARRGTIAVKFSSPTFHECGANVRITLGDTTVQANRKAASMPNAPLGAVTYRIAGFVMCSGARFDVTGSGELTLETGDTLYPRFERATRTITLSKTPDAPIRRPEQ